jgi:hypothetical protein
VSQTPDGRDICFAFNSQWAIACLQSPWLLRRPCGPRAQQSANGRG